MNVDRRWRVASAPKVRVLLIVIVLIATGCAVLGWGSRLGQSNSPAKTAANFPAQWGTGATAAPVSNGSAVSSSDSAKQAESLLKGMPLFFEPNQGQGDLDPADARARFVNRGSGYSLFLGSEGAMLSIAAETPTKRSGQRASTPQVEFLQMKLAGANADAALSSSDMLPGKSNYFIGDNPAKWRTGVPHFARVRYANVYPGINLVFYGKQGQLEYDFQVAPGADPRQAELQFVGAKTVALKDGVLIVAGKHGTVRFEVPRVYQEVGGEQRTIEGNFVVRGANRVGFRVGDYDRSRELIIDPILNFSSYFGGSGDEHTTWVAVDPSLNVYIAGSTTSTNLPVTPCTYTGCGTLNGAQNVYVAKITPPLGSITAKLDDVTYLGGSGTDTPAGIAVDGASNVFVAGTTSSGNFPTTATNAYQSKPLAGSTGTTHAFVTKIKYDFSQLNYSSYLSGNGTDAASGMAVDSADNVYVTGTTTSNNPGGGSVQFPASIAPTQTAFQPIPYAAIQFFVTQVNTNNSGVGSLSYSTYFGGSNFNPPSGTTLPTVIGGGIAVDPNGIVYFTGTTNFTFTGCSVGCGDFPILNAYQPCLDQPSTSVPVNSPSCTYTTPPTDPDAFVAKLNPAAAVGQQLVWSTYVGGTGSDLGAGVGLDPGATNVYLVGTTNSPDIGKAFSLTTSAAYQPCLDQPGVAVGACTPPATPPNDAFVARLSNPTPTGTTSTSNFVALNFFTYLGGSANDEGLAIAVDTNSGALVTGWTQSGDFPIYPTANPIQSVLNGPQDAFIARINTAAVIGQTTTASWANYFGGSGTDAGTGIALDVNQNTYVAGETNSTDLQMAKPVQGTNAGGYDAFVTQLGTAVSLSISGVLTLGTSQTFISAGNPATFTYTVTNNGPDLASGIIITANMDQSITNVQLTNITATVSAGNCSSGTSSATSISCGPISLQSGSTATVTITATPNATSTGISPLFFNGGTIQALAPGNIVLAQTSVSAQMSDFGMTISPLNQSVPVAGLSATYSVQLTPLPIYNSSITFSCSGTPSASACQFNPSSVALQSTSGGTSTLTITTTARPATNTAANAIPRQFYAMWLLVPGLAFVGLGRRRRIVGLSLVGIVLCLLMLLPSCSHGFTQVPPAGTPAGNYTITVTAASGSDSKSKTVTLNVP
ncbi:MAG TPA: SBBP repeat-containing protein [Candidatus Sulfotelmatobacter sp.]|nr:SBBP repeat-containing protein [Candidatus Sulfotelmatobacter sp.]